MKIGVIGSGVVGQVLASGFLKHGHQAMLGTRDPQKPDVRKWAQENPGGKVGTFAETAEFADLVVLVMLGAAAESAIALAGLDNLAGKVIIDTTNPIAGAPVDGGLPYTVGPNESLAEKVQAAAPRTHVVKAFNSVGNALMVNPQFEAGATHHVPGAVTTPAPKPRSRKSSRSSAGNLSIAAASLRRARWNRSACCGACRDSCAMSGITPSNYCGSRWRVASAILSP